ncbi:DUF2652 domain-containing protein [Nibribacter ruber]|uniref:DUF2652 domain-containing protein n=1 Tax=Nibribacter ruber TaxID=2698458 RepID=A0A6P1P2E4_9BACT|nr:DUF2652 domain-containing protein [Nibribacter ruber]QHL88568.1 DUF2652 domain-containing protein [Nibribacter ruber]
MEFPEMNSAFLPDEADDTQPALLFIPDISGFTRFMHENKIKYSRNLIADLLETIIEANILNLEVCEIQGDAILFYKLGAPPTIDEMVNQCKQIFLDFQNYLKIMERDGSLLGTHLSENKLTLKIVAHYGRISVTQIRNYTKLMGMDVILAHRLLKNNIEGSEYVLLSEGYLNTQNPEAVEKSFEWTQLKEGSTEYEHMGRVRYKYAFLTPLRLLVTDPEAEHNRHQYPNTFSLEAKVHAPVELVGRVIRNYRLKPAWMQGMKTAQYDITKSDRSGTYCKCEMEKGGVIEIQTLQFKMSDDHVEYIEKITNFKMFPNALLFLKAYATGPHTTLLTLEFHYSRVSVGDYFYDFFGRKQMRDFMGKSLKRLKELCEQMQTSKIS